MYNSLQLSSKSKKLSNVLTRAYNDASDKVLVIVPCYNEEKNIERAINTLIDKTKLKFLIVDDCSTDNSEKIIKKNG